MKKRILSLVLAVMMIVTLLPISASAASSTENNNQYDGIVLRKYASAHKDDNGIPDGTVDVIIEAFTTGKVTSTAYANPTDIVLVLDVSGSMSNDGATEYTTTYDPVDGTTYRTIGWFELITHYGFRNADSSTYFVESGTGYTQVYKDGGDANMFDYFQYVDGNGETQYVYPVLDSEPNAEREFDYPVVQFYTRTQSSTTVTKLELLKNGVHEFINHTASLNAGVASTADMHRISIVKYADNSYYNANEDVKYDDINDNLSATIGNDRQDNSDRYNYTQQVTELVPVDVEGAVTLTNAVDSLAAAGATAVDYGMQMAKGIINGRTDGGNRNKVVIVFTDGTPTHGSNYDSTVAGAAVNIAHDLKNAGVEVYTVSVDSGANPGELGTNGNMAMHYISSNYPDATYDTASDTFSEGVGGSIYGQHYMTPSGTTELVDLFDTIVHNIGAPDINIGADSSVIDTISPYFTLPNGADDVKVYTVEKIGPGSSDNGTPAIDSTLVPQIDGKTIAVPGFDFDANYISSTPRKVDGEDFYGKKLIIVINVTPDYDAIDASGSATGTFNTNSAANTLKIVDNRTGAVIAETASPDITMHKINYYVEDAEEPVSTYYRLAGSENELRTPPNIVGKTFVREDVEGVTVTDRKFTMPENDVDIRARYTTNSYDVIYRYVGNVPEGADDAPETMEYGYNTTVTVEDEPADIEGYTFTGWTTTDVEVADGEFTMPATKVTFVGTFAANTNIPYTVKHYTETLTEGVYEVYNEYTVYGTTGENTITASPLTIEGFTYNPTHANTVTGPVEIEGDGSTVLSLYYDRDEYTVTYAYETPLPNECTPSALPQEKTYKFGETVEVADPATAEGFDFHGWFSEQVAVNGQTEFIMPNENVLITGHFVAHSNTPYTVEHYLEKTDAHGTYELVENGRMSLTGEAGKTVTAAIRSYIGHTYNSTKSETTRSGEIAADGTTVLKLYYDLAEYTVTYGYLDAVPEDATDIATTPYGTATYKYGDTVTVAADATSAGHIFYGWRSVGGTVTEDMESFTMPAQNVILRGQFTVKNNYQYQIEHYVQIKGTSDYSTNYSDYSLYQKSEIFNNGVFGNTIVAKPMNVVGHDYFPEISTATHLITAADDENEVITLKLYYVRYPQYKVTYEYKGTVPTGVTPAAPVDANLYILDEEVNVIDVTAPVGYTFSGWSSIMMETLTPDQDSFNMPAKDVHLTGHFIASASSYKVEHYLEKLNGGYELEDSVTFDENIHVGDGVAASANIYPGFSPTPSPQSQYFGTVSVDEEGNPTLVLKIYYNRNSYKVTYGWYGEVPATAPALPAGGTYKYGETVQLEFVTAPDTHEFDGWYSSQHDDIRPGATEFVMPARDVPIVGQLFEKKIGEYEIQHIIVNNNGTTKVLDELTVTGEGIVGTPVYATPKTVDGYSYFAGISTMAGKIHENTKLVLKVYYTAEKADYTVEYYFEQKDGSYAINDEYTINETVYVGDFVRAPEKKFEDYELTNHKDTVASGIVLADGTLTLKLFYERDSDSPFVPLYYKVTYIIDGETYEVHHEIPGAVHEIIDIPDMEADKPFDGWSEPYNTKTKEYFESEDGEFKMPNANVEIYGSYDVDKTGAIEITKTLNAPDGFTAPEGGFKFTIYKMNGDDKVVVDTVYVEAGESEKVVLPKGEYIVEEEPTNISGYDHKIVSGLADGKITVEGGVISKVTFENIYTKFALNRDDHVSYIIGKPDGLSHPEATITRAEVATIFFRLLMDDAREANLTETNSFSDVEPTAWYNTAVSTLEAMDIFKGYGGLFRPDDAITRAEFAAIAARFSSVTGGENKEFSDVSDHWAEIEIQKAASLGWIEGWDGEYRPDDSITRAEAMTIVNRVLHRLPEAPSDLLASMKTWDDNMDTSKWYYLAVQEATNSHTFEYKDGVHERWIELIENPDWKQYEIND